jgi:hypothetical protein
MGVSVRSGERMSSAHLLFKFNSSLSGRVVEVVVRSVSREALLASAAQVLQLLTR